MKSVIKTLILYIIIPILGIIILDFAIWHYVIATTDLTISENKKCLCFGSSMTETCINDSILERYVNCGRSAAELDITKNFIEAMISNNSSVDTIFIELSQKQFCIDDDGPQDGFNFSYFENFEDMVAYKGISVFKEYGFYELVPAFLSIRNISRPRYGFSKVYRNNIDNNGQWSVHWCDSILPQQKKLSYEESMQLKYRQIEAMMELCKLCKSKSITLVIFNPPSYNIENWYDPHNYCEYVKTLEGNVLIADYAYFQFPDISYYGDVFHLNPKGADYFSEYINKNGWHLETPNEFYNRKMNN